VVGIPIVLIQVQSSKVMRKDQISGQVQRSRSNTNDTVLLISNGFPGNYTFAVS